jgi:hypothetical protein
MTVDHYPSTIRLSQAPLAHPRHIDLVQAHNQILSTDCNDNSSADQVPCFHDDIYNLAAYHISDQHPDSDLGLTQGKPDDYTIANSLSHRHHLQAGGRKAS